MQDFADTAKSVDKDFSPWYNGIVKSKRLQKRTTPAREAVETQDADAETNFKL
jgi:hypothetical protein